MQTNGIETCKYRSKAWSWVTKVSFANDFWLQGGYCVDPWTKEYLQVENEEVGEGEYLHMGSAQRESLCRDGDWSAYNLLCIEKLWVMTIKIESVRMWRSVNAHLVWNKESTIVQSIEKQREIPHMWSGHTCRNHKECGIFHNICNHSAILLSSTCSDCMLQVKNSKSILSTGKKLFLKGNCGFPQLYLHLPFENFWIDFIATLGYLWLDSVCERELVSNSITFVCAWDFRQWGESELKKDWRIQLVNFSGLALRLRKNILNHYREDFRPF